MAEKNEKRLCRYDTVGEDAKKHKELLSEIELKFFSYSKWIVHQADM